MSTNHRARRGCRTNAWQNATEDGACRRTFHTWATTRSWLDRRKIQDGNSLRPGRASAFRAAVLCSTVLGCLCMDGGAGPLQAFTHDSALPCNEICRAWLSWAPDRDAPNVRHIDHSSREAARGERGPRPHAAPPARQRAPLGTHMPSTARPMRPVETALPARAKSRPTTASVEEVRAASPRRALPPIPPRRPSEAEIIAGPSNHQESLPSPIGSQPEPQDEAAVRLRAASDAADAAILAQPLYQPPPSSAAEVTEDGKGGAPVTRVPEAPNPAAARPGTPRTGEDHNDHGAKQGEAPHVQAVEPTVRRDDSVPATVPPAASAGSSPVHPAASSVTMPADRSRPATPDLAAPMARPASDLETLDAAKVTEPRKSVPAE